MEIWKHRGCNDLMPCRCLVGCDPQTLGGHDIRDDADEHPSKHIKNVMPSVHYPGYSDGGTPARDHCDPRGVIQVWQSEIWLNPAEKTREKRYSCRVSALKPR
jgi:hypothetical protein